MDIKTKKVKVTVQDMAWMHSMAAKFAADLSIKSYFNKDTQQLMAYAWTVAAVSLLNGKGMLELEVEVDKGYDNAD